ncbi:peptidoglycan bridge formation glycyltransferase FemA/FemB family protein, partial [Patescibacteria group bacterium]|nr:peptidoglycan bridge formation glycyltransferase FemA/FemB family protein [Patescibacteria group bacterium]
VMSKSGIAHLFLAKYQNQVLATYIFFVFNKVLYYPYGASTREYRETMPTYALFWEAIKFGQKMGCQLFDMWGSPGPNPSPRDPWYGFHQFKEGFGGELVKFIGTYDLVINPSLYFLFNLANNLRWKLLHLKPTISF